ncbi:FAD dependent oxidoreductase [Arenibacter palladensis]|uniref:FAD dependent oxidoreductase n=1 Tax=Arenibacter palladensis TaxID=237373 RepID=A0A1M5AY05_9FLAO|nr:FAD-dependent oxidoreductase [Arenibacter palladensis]SHF35118.1 FAD dependent oxidoreductase [Arenibacter palladensis]
MSNIKRRSLLKTIGLASVGIMTPSLLKSETLKEPYKIIEKSVKTDVLIVGGGTAGTIAAIQAGRAGAKTILIESGSQLGGTTTTGGVSFPGIFHTWGKQIIGGIGWELVLESVELNGDKLPDFSKNPDRHWKHQVAVNPAIYALLAEEKCIEAGVDVRFYETPIKVEFKEGMWWVESVGKGVKNLITCSQIIDCTGNALIASMDGYDLLREEDTQPGSLVFSMEGYDIKSLDLTKIPKKYHGYLHQNKLESQIRTTGENTSVPYGYVYVNGADNTTAETHTLANQQGRRNLLKLIRNLKELPGCENIRITNMKTETAVRETYRIDGVYKITHEDYVSGKIFDDSLSYSFYPVDLHRDGKSIYQEFLKPEIVASIPLRALIPKSSSNFLVAGRCVSSDRLANSGLRVQASCMGMGQAAAATAVLAHKRGITPSNVPISDIKELLKVHGAIIPGAI